MRPPRRTTVPLWLALLLKKQHKCNIVPPDWLSHEYLEKLLREEENSPDRFCELPFRWLETAELLLEAAPDDLPLPPPSIVSAGLSDLRVLLRGLREIRQAKAREGLRSLESDSKYVHFGLL
jgi:GINS complex subunit 2